MRDALFLLPVCFRGLIQRTARHWGWGQQQKSLCIITEVLDLFRRVWRGLMGVAGVTLPGGVYSILGRISRVRSTGPGSTGP